MAPSSYKKAAEHRDLAVKTPNCAHGGDKVPLKSDVRMTQVDRRAMASSAEEQSDPGLHTYTITQNSMPEDASQRNNHRFVQRFILSSLKDLEQQTFLKHLHGQPSEGLLNKL